MRLYVGQLLLPCVIATFLLASAHLSLCEKVEKSSDPTTWPGHLQPLGAAAEKKPIASIEGFPSPEDFFDEYLSTHTPVVFRGAAKSSPAFSLWSDEYFLSFKEAEDVEVTAEQRKKEVRTVQPDKPSFKEFLETYREKDIYMVNGVPKFLLKDVYLPTPLLCGGHTKTLQDRVMWFSSGGTSSVLHNDDVDNINCLMRGTKDLVMIPYKYKKEVNIDRTGGYSSVDVDKVDFTKYPGLADVEYFSVHMEPGDCLYIPLNYYHQVRSTGNNIAVNTWFKAVKKFDNKDCQSKQPLNTSQSLDQFEFHAIEENIYGERDGEEEGDGTEEMALPQDMRDFFKAVLGKDKTMTRDEYMAKLRKHEIFTVEGVMWSDELAQWAKDSFEALDTDGNSVVDKKEVSKWSSKKERKIERFAQKLEDILVQMTETEPNTSDQRPREDDELEFEEDPTGEEDPNFTEQEEDAGAKDEL